MDDTESNLFAYKKNLTQSSIHTNTHTHIHAQIPMDDTESNLFAYKQTSTQGRQMELAQIGGGGGLGVR